MLYFLQDLHVPALLVGGCAHLICLHYQVFNSLKW